MRNHIAMRQLHTIRNDYTNARLTDEFKSHDPLQLFDKWLSHALESEVYEPTAMSLSTVSGKGTPSSRIVLLKHVISNSFFFFSNFESRKGLDLAQNNNGALLFFWPQLERQIRIEGLVSKCEDSFSDLYFYQRPKPSQISACVSPQSRPIESIEMLERMTAQALSSSTKIERPSNWGGYQLNAHFIEFWQGGPNRLHDRLAFTLKNDNWLCERLAP